MLSRIPPPDRVRHFRTSFATAAASKIRLLGALGDRFGQEPAHAPPEDVLLAKNPQLETRGDAGGELHDPIVEKRETRFNRMRHRYPVTLRGENIAGQKVRRLQKLSAA
jgi:hypothetical protein